MLRVFHLTFFSCCNNFMLHSSEISFSFMLLHSFHVALFPCCNFLILHFFHVALFHTAHISRCTLFRQHIFHTVLFSYSIALFSCCTLFNLRFFHVALFPCLHAVLFRGYTIPCSNFFHAALFHLAILHAIFFLLLFFPCYIGRPRQTKFCLDYKLDKRISRNITTFWTNCDKCNLLRILVIRQH